MGKRCKQVFPKEKMWIISKYMKICLASLAIKQMHIKNTVRYHYTPVKMAKIKYNDETKCL